MAGKGNNDPRTMNHSLEHAQAGDGFRKDIPLPFGLWTLSTGATLGTATDPAREAGGNRTILNFKTGSTGVATCTMDMPGEYATGEREVKLRLMALQTGSTDAITLTGTIFAIAPNGAEKGPFTKTFKVTADRTTSQLAQFDFTNMKDAAGKKIEPRDALTIRVSTGSTNPTDDVQIHGAGLTIRTNANLTNKDWRHG